MEPQAITENFSENAPKRKRGRPSMFIGGKSDLWPEYHGRSLCNQWYGLLAYMWLKERPECAWLFEKDEHGDYKRITLQYELGRFGDPQAAYRAALALCENKPKVRDGITFLRRWRLQDAGNPPALAGDPDRLGSALLSTLNEHLTRYPETPPADILAALASLTYSVKAHYGLG